MKIALTGSHSTGKTTILNNIVHPNKIQEIARNELIKDVKPHEMSTKERIIFQCDYWELQKKTEDSKKDFLSDRCLLDVLAYDLDIMKCKDVYAMLPKLVGRYDVLCYIPIEFTLKDDGIRNPDVSYQIIIDNRIKDLLKRLQQLDQRLIVDTLNGTIEQRTNKLKDLIN